MFCENCGKEINDKAVICPMCGVPTGKFVLCGVAAEQKKEFNVVALVGFILAFFVPLAGLICSIIGYRRCINAGLDGKPFAVAGIIISVVFMVIITIAIVILIIAILSYLAVFGLTLFAFASFA